MELSNHSVLGHFFLARKPRTGSMAPTGKPRRSKLNGALPKSLCGPSVPQKTAAVKNVLMPGQVNPQGAAAVQIPLRCIWKLKTPVHTKVEMNVATIWAMNVVLGGILV